MAGRQKRRARLEAEKRLAEAQKRIADRNATDREGSQPTKKDKAIEVEVERIREAINQPHGDITAIWRSEFVAVKNPEKLPDEVYVAAALRSFGNVSIMARLLGCYHKHIYNRINTSAALAEVMAEARNMFIDLAEARLIESVANSDDWAVKFTLETLGKGRGYTKEHIPEDHKGSILSAINRMLDGETLGGA